MEFPRLGNSAIFDRRRHLEEGLCIEIAVGRPAIGLPGRTAVTMVTHVHDGHELYIRAAKALYLDAEAVVALTYLAVLIAMQKGIDVDVNPVIRPRVCMHHLHPTGIGLRPTVRVVFVFLFLLTAA
jgi:hypothetical protein